MDQIPKTEQKAAAEFDVVPPGPIHRNKRMMLAKFLQSTPAFASKPTSQWKLHPEKQKQPSKPRPQPGPPPSTSNVPWVLERDGDVVQRGVPDGPTMGTATPSQPTTSHASSYFVFLKHGNTITAFPVDDVFNFKPLPRRPGAQPQTLESAELAMKSTRNMPGQSDLRLVPKSVKDAALRNAELKGVTPATKGRGKGGKGGKEDQSAILMASLFGEDDEEERPQKRGGGGRGRGKATRAADGTELEAQEMPDDIYEGEQDDELRPAKPGKAEDWEHEEFRDDDDLGQGEEESEKLEDDPGERRKLGIEGGSEEEAEEEDEEVKKRKEQEEEGTGEQGVKYEGMEQDAVDTSNQGVTAAAGEGEDDLDLDAMAMDAFGSAPRVTSSSVKRKVEDEQPVPQIAGQPPRQGAAKRARTAAPAPGQAAPAPKQQSPAPPQAAAPAAPPAEVTKEEIARELQKAGGGLPLQQIRAIFAPRLKAKSTTDAFKSSLLQVACSDKGPDGKNSMVVLKDEWRQKQ